MLSEARKKQIDYISKLPESTEVVDDSDPITDVVVDSVVETVLEGQVDTQQRKKFVSVQKILKLKVIPPLRKELFTDATTFENAMMMACSDILKVFSPHVRPLITISRTNMKIGPKMMKILLVVAPVEAEEDVARVKLQGLKILKRTVFPTSEDFWEIRNSQNPKTTDIRITNLPALCDEQQLDELLQIPEDLERGQLLREKLETELGKVYTGKAKISIKIGTKEQEEDLQKWSYSKSFSDVAHWCELPIYANIPSIHECAKCKEEGRPRWRGHHENWCKINREKKLPVNEQKIFLHPQLW